MLSVRNVVIVIVWSLVVATPSEAQEGVSLDDLTAAQLVDAWVDDIESKPTRSQV